MALRGVTGSSIRVEGLSQLIRDFNRMNKDLARDLRRELLDVGKIVADEAKDVQIPDQQLAGGQAGEDSARNTGRLQKGVRPRMRGTAVIVENRAKNRGYGYPAIYEFNKGRPFLNPALDARTEDVVEALDDMLNRLVSANGFGRGGIL